MRITFVLPGYPRRPVGGFRVVYEYANYLVARGHDVTVVHARGLPTWTLPSPASPYKYLRRYGGYLYDLVREPHVTWHRIDPLVQMRFTPMLTSSDLPDADVVFATGWQTVDVVLDAKRSKGRKFYLIQGYETWCGQDEQVNATWHAPLYKVVIAKWLYRKGLELGVPADEMVHIPIAIDHSFYRLLRSIEQRPPRVAMMYSDAAWKGGNDGVSALLAAKQEYPALQAVLFGVRSRPRSLPGWMEYLRNPPQEVIVEKVYNGSSIFLCPSLTEGWPLPGAEAMAGGCALVSTDNGGVTDYAEHNVGGLLSAPRDPPGLTSNILRLLRDERMRVRLAKNGNERILGFTWQNSVNQMEQLLDGTLALR